MDATNVLFGSASGRSMIDFRPTVPEPEKVEEKPFYATKKKQKLESKV